MWSNTLNRISFFALFLVVVLLPVFFLPFTKIPIEISKGLLLVIGLSLSLIFWIAGRFSEGKIVLPKSYILLSSLGVVLVYFISAIASGSRAMSFFGVMFDVGTFWFIFATFLLMLMSSIILGDAKRARMVLWGVLISSAIVLVLQVFRLFLPQALSFGILAGKMGNIFGSWNSLGLWAGFSTILSLLVIEFLPVSKNIKWSLGGLIVLSLFISILVNFYLIWGLLGVFALFIFIYKIYFFSGRQQNEEKKIYFPASSFAIFMVSLLFFTSGQFIVGVLPASLKLPNVEVRPDMASTLTVGKMATAQDPVWGIGPNRFADAWAMYKPATINASQFWDSSFDFGAGLLPTLLATTGFFGILFWLSFFVLFVMYGGRSVFASLKNGTNFEATIFFLIALFLFGASLFYPVGIVIFALAMAFAGIFLGLFFSGFLNEEVSIYFFTSPRKSFIFITIFVVAMTASATLSFKYMERLVGVSYFGKALSATNIPEAESAIGKAVSLSPNDLYLRTYSQAYLLKINALVSKDSAFSEADRAELQKSVTQAVNGVTLATTYNSKNYFNFQMLGFVYDTLGTLGIEGGYDKAISAYQQASTLNPLNPGLKLAIARAYLASGQTKEAKDYAEQSLALKPDYVDTLVALSQIAKSENNNTEAISFAEKALALLPGDVDLIQYVNSLKTATPASAVKTDKQTGR